MQRRSWPGKMRMRVDSAQSAGLLRGSPIPGSLRKLQRLCGLLLLGAALSEAALATAADEVQPSAAEILREAMVARGGEAAAMKIHSFQAKGTVAFDTLRGPWWGASRITNVWPLEVDAMRPDKFRSRTDLDSLPGASSVFVPPRYYDNGFDGRTAWEVLPGVSPHPLKGIFGEERREAARFFAWCAEPRDYRAITNLGISGFQGRRCYQLRLMRRSGNPETRYYDVSSHLLAGLVRSSVFGPSREQFEFEDYREFGGFKFPMRIRCQAEDERDQAHLCSVEQFTTLEVNTVKDSVFRMPEKAGSLSETPATPVREITDAEIKAMLRDWVESDKLAQCIVVGLLDEHGRRVISEGKLDGKDVNGDTVFALASISKVFTRLLLLDMVQRGEMRLDNSAQQYLPAAVHLPTRDGKQITLLHLATHSSGLPRYIPGSVQEVYARLSAYKLTRDPGERYEYSNTGMGLLGKAIEQRAGEPYPDLIDQRICRPLGMDHTGVMHVPFPGIDGVKSTANDLLTFASACLGLSAAPSALGPLMRHEYATHGGAGGEARLYLVLDPVRRRALVTLARSSDAHYSDVQAALNHLILNQSPKPLHMGIVDPNLYNHYVGQYLAGDNSVWTVRRDGHRLLLEKPRGAACELYPLSATRFTNRLMGIGAKFVCNSAKQSPQLILYRLDKGLSWRGSRISTQAPVRAVTVDLAPSTANECTGCFKGPAGEVLIIRHEDGQFTAEIGARDPADVGVEPLVCESKTSFASLIGPAAYTFLRDESGKVKSVIRHVYGSHNRYAKFAPVPPRLAGADSDRFMGVWKTTVSNDGGREKHVTLRIFNSAGVWHATIDVPENDITNQPFGAPVFLSRTNIFLWISSGKSWASFPAVLNGNAAKLSGLWKESESGMQMPLVFKRVEAKRRKIAPFHEP